MRVEAKGARVLDAIKRFFDGVIEPGVGAEGDDEHTLHLAMAALLLEMTRVDHEVDEQERAMVERLVREQLGLDRAESDQLLELAEAQREVATDYFQFTHLINRSFSAERKAELVEGLWRVAFADGRLHRYEEHLVRKLAELLHVPHSRFIAAKHRAKERS